MTATARATRPAPVTAPAGAPGPRVARTGALRLVPQGRTTAARTPFVVVVVGSLTLGLLALLLLNTVVDQGAFALHALRAQGIGLSDTEQGLDRQVAALEAPAVLAQRAAALGLVPGGPPAFLRLRDGAILGQAAPAAGPPTALPAPSAQPATGPVGQPSAAPSPAPPGVVAPAKAASAHPSAKPSAPPAARPSSPGSGRPSAQPASRPSSQPSARPSGRATPQPTPSPGAHR